MSTFFFTLLTGIALGVLDILPMLKMKLDMFSIVSAFVFYLIAPFIVYSSNLFGMSWWLKGSAITFLMAVPIIILVAKDGMTSAMPMIVMSIVLGIVMSAVGHFLLKVM